MFDLICRLLCVLRLTMQAVQSAKFESNLARLKENMEVEMEENRRELERHLGEFVVYGENVQIGSFIIFCFDCTIGLRRQIQLLHIYSGGWVATKTSKISTHEPTYVILSAPLPIDTPSFPTPRLTSVTNSKMYVTIHHRRADGPLLVPHNAPLQAARRGRQRAHRR